MSSYFNTSPWPPCKWFILDGLVSTPAGMSALALLKTKLLNVAVFIDWSIYAFPSILRCWFSWWGKSVSLCTDAPDKIDQRIDSFLPWVFTMLDIECPGLTHHSLPRSRADLNILIPIQHLPKAEGIGFRASCPHQGKRPRVWLVKAGFLWWGYRVCSGESHPGWAECSTKCPKELIAGCLEFVPNISGKWSSGTWTLHISCQDWWSSSSQFSPDIFGGGWLCMLVVSFSSTFAWPKLDLRFIKTLTENAFHSLGTGAKLRYRERAYLEFCAKEEPRCGFLTCSEQWYLQWYHPLVLETHYRYMRLIRFIQIICDQSQHIPTSVVCYDGRWGYVFFLWLTNY